MKILNKKSGKIGFCQVGPINYLDEDIRLGEVALCIDRLENNAEPCVWLIAGIEQAIDYISVGRNKGIISPENAVLLLSKLDQAKRKVPNTPIGRLSTALGGDATEVFEILKLAQVSITNPIIGVKNFKDNIVSWGTGNSNFVSNK